jgi:hypothetical protein
MYLRGQNGSDGMFQADIVSLLLVTEAIKEDLSLSFVIV